MGCFEENGAGSDISSGKGSYFENFSICLPWDFAHLKIEKGGYNNLQTAGRDKYG